MAISDSRELVIEATPSEILDVLADIESLPSWSSQYEQAEVLDTHEDGRPRQVKMTVKAAGRTDTVVTEYTWTDNSVSWALVSSSQLKSQDAKYTLTPDNDVTAVRFDMAMELLIPIPELLLKIALKSGLNTATDGLREQVLKVKNG
ncbi:SRPBCC family protein [Mycobacterium sp. smrl_JER01]|uniref:SRPBCC family protein n=1 Tax=Mycobacterium sp. smrl_JER01 TaxID=3402633 RepID=UPI003ACF3E7F